MVIARADFESEIKETESQLGELEKLPEKEKRVEQLAFWVGSAVAFGAGIWYILGPTKGKEYFAGYLLGEEHVDTTMQSCMHGGWSITVSYYHLLTSMILFHAEQSLSVDNLFVFILVFNYFKTPPKGQKTVLTYGIATAAVLRAVMILLGIELINVCRTGTAFICFRRMVYKPPCAYLYSHTQKFEPLLAFFALILLYSSFKLLTAGDEDEDEDLSNNAIVNFCKKVFIEIWHFCLSCT